MASEANSEQDGPPEVGGCTGCCLMCCFGCLTCCGCRVWLTRKIIFFPPQPPFYKLNEDDNLLRIPLELLPNSDTLTPDDVKLMGPVNIPKGFEMKMARIKTSRGSTIVACHVTHSRAKNTIIYSHGNATDVGMQSYGAESLVVACRVNVLFYDYTGYGFSSKLGKPSHNDIGADAEAAYQYLIKQGVLPENIILYGQSLGSVPSCILASKHKVKGLVIHSGIASAVRVIKPSIKASPWFDLFKNADMIKKARCPVFVMHGTKDEAVPMSNGKLLYNNAPMKIDPWWVTGATHNNIEADYAREYYLRLLNAIKKFEKLWKEKGQDDVKKNGVITAQPGSLNGGSPYAARATTSL